VGHRHQKPVVGRQHQIVDAIEVHAGLDTEHRPLNLTGTLLGVAGGDRERDEKNQ
jgi:hypothetical protein